MKRVSFAPRTKSSVNKEQMDMADKDGNEGSFFRRLNPVKAFNQWAYGDSDENPQSPPVAGGGTPVRQAYRRPVVAVAAMTSPGVTYVPDVPAGGGSSDGVNHAASNQVGNDLAEKAPDEYRLVATLLQGFAAAVPDVGQRYQMVVVSLQAQGKSADAVLAAFDAYLKEIDDYAAGFQQSLAAERNTALGDADAELQALDGDIKGKNAEIGAIQAELADLESRRSQINDAMASKRAELQVVEQTVSATLSEVRGRVAQELQQFQQHVK
jgi:hypothetical protein